MASFLTDVPRTVHPVSVVFDVAAAEVLSLYRSRDRAALDDERLLAVIGRGNFGGCSWIIAGCAGAMNCMGDPETFVGYLFEA